MRVTSVPAAANRPEPGLCRRFKAHEYPSNYVDLPTTKLPCLHMSQSLLIIFALIGLSFPSAAGTILYQSATLGATGVLPGYVIFDAPGFATQFYGARFSLTQTSEVTAVGGHLGGGGSVLASVLSLTGPTALPSGNPFDSTTLGSVLLAVPQASADIRAPLSLLLSPGYYGLVFSASSPSAPMSPTLISDNTPAPNASYFQFVGISIPPVSPEVWSNVLGGDLYNTRFVVEGNVVPEPTSFGLFLAGLIGVIAVSRPRKPIG
jgi:hypothetical protein